MNDPQHGLLTPKGWSMDPFQPNRLIVQDRTRELEYELVEAKSEIARHHRDFETIREILTWADDGITWEALRFRLDEIRKVVG